MIKGPERCQITKIARFLQIGTAPYVQVHGRSTRSTIYEVGILDSNDDIMTKNKTLVALALRSSNTRCTRTIITVYTPVLGVRSPEYCRYVTWNCIYRTPVLRTRRGSDVRDST